MTDATEACIREVLGAPDIPHAIKLSMIEAALNGGAAPAVEPAKEQGTTCPKCGGHSFRLAATFDGEVCVTFTLDDDEFVVDDSEARDSEWDGPATCRDCGWSGDLTDLVADAADAAVDAATMAPVEREENDPYPERLFPEARNN